MCSVSPRNINLLFIFVYNRLECANNNFFFLLFGLLRQKKFILIGDVVSQLFWARVNSHSGENHTKRKNKKNRETFLQMEGN